jgi:hypothetical protein
VPAVGPPPRPGRCSVIPAVPVHLTFHATFFIAARRIVFALEPPLRTECDHPIGFVTLPSAKNLLNGDRDGGPDAHYDFTCRLSSQSVDHLTELQRHAVELKRSPAEWMPWNYRETLARLAAPAAASYNNPAWPERIVLGHAGA